MTHPRRITSLAAALATLAGWGISAAPAAQLDAKINLFVPGSTGLTAGKGGILLEPGDTPDSALETAQEGFGSQDLEVTQPGLSFSMKKKPTTWAVKVSETGFAPASVAFPAGVRAGLGTFALENRGTRAHQFRANFLTNQAIVVLEGKDFTIPPPVSRAPRMIITEGSRFNLNAERKYSGFHLDLQPGSRASITVDFDQYVRIPELSRWVRDKRLTVACTLPGHNEALVVKLP